MATLQSPLTTSAGSAGLTIIGAGSGTVPAATNWIVTMITVANIVGASIVVQVTIYNGVTDFSLVKNYTLSQGDTLILGNAGAKLILGAGWAVRVNTNTASSYDATMSYASVP
jgi:hypothetical protein